MSAEPRYSLEVDAKRRPPARVQHPDTKLWYYATGRRGTAYVNWGSRDDNRRVYEYAYSPVFPQVSAAAAMIWIWIDGHDIRVLTDFEIEDGDA